MARPSSPSGGAPPSERASAVSDREAALSASPSAAAAEPPEGPASTGAGGGPRRRSPFRRVTDVLSASLGIVAVLVIWHFSSVFLSRGEATGATLLPSPVSVLTAGAEMVRDGSIFGHIAASLKRVLIAFFVASAVAVPLGVAMGWWKALHRQIDPVMEFFRPIPPLAWIPLSILWFGTGDRQNEFIIFLGVFFPVLLNTIASVRNVDPLLIRAGRSLGADRLRLMQKVVIPGSLPGIITGLRVGLGIGWMALVAAELVASSSGLGFLINDSRFIFRTDRILLGMAVIGLLGLLMDRLLRLASRVLVPWHAASR